MESVDREVLSEAVDLCKKVGLSKRYDPQTISWSANVPWDACHFTPGVRRRTDLALPLSLRGKLDSSQWRPLLAYSMIQLRSRRSSTLVPFFIYTITLVAFIFTYAIVSLLLGPVPILALGIIPVFVLSSALSLRHAKKTFLRFLREAANVEGRETMLSVLEKIDSLNLPEVERGKGRGPLSRLWPIPSITDRIEYLRSLN